MVTSAGGALCHAAIIARELGVPCVTGVANAMQALRLDRMGAEATVAWGFGMPARVFVIARMMEHWHMA